MSDHDHDHAAPAMPQYLLDAAAEGCEESKLLINRRNLLGLSAGLFSWAHMPRHAEAAGTEKRLLIVLLNGGVDGLHVAPPIDDPNYANLRGSLAYTKDQLLQPNPQMSFWLNSAMPKFTDMFKAGDASVIQAVAPPLSIGSHFENRYSIESGQPKEQRVSKDGWLNRVLQVLPAGHPVNTTSMHIGATPLILTGAAPVMAWSSSGVTQTSNLDDPLISLYQTASPKTKADLAALLKSGLALQKIAANATTSVVLVNPTSLQTSFLSTARLMAANEGPRIAVLNVDGWDTHSSESATLATKLADLDSSLDIFRRVLGPAWETTAVICVTEFGRRAFVNGSRGTDHGNASVALLLGGAVNGGKVFGDFPGLGPTQLDSNKALVSTTDMRSIFKGLLQDHLEVPSTLIERDVFPLSSKLAPAMKDLLKARTTTASQLTSASSRRSNAAAGSTSRNAKAMAQPRYETAYARFSKANSAN